MQNGFVNYSIGYRSLFATSNIFAGSRSNVKLHKLYINLSKSNIIIKSSNIRKVVFMKSMYYIIMLHTKVII